MGFCLYWNHVHHVIRIHRDECPHANFGHGVHDLSEHERERDEWVVGFETYSLAQSAARDKAAGFGLTPENPDLYEIKNCQTCAPELEGVVVPAGRKTQGTRRSSTPWLRRDERLCPRCGLMKAARQFVEGSELCRDCR